MQDCWREDPDDRPTFENLRDELKEMENQYQVACEHPLSLLKILHSFIQWHCPCRRHEWFFKLIEKIYAYHDMVIIISHKLELFEK